MELKYLSHLWQGHNIGCFNCTFMELKCQYSLHARTLAFRFNCTFMELKSNQDSYA